MNLEHYKNAFPLHLGSRFLLMCLSLMLILPLSAQETIGKVKKQAVVEDCHNTFNPTPEELEQILIQENQFQARKGQIMAALQEGRMPALAIPVQIHIVRRSDGTGGISEASILSEFNNYVTPRYAGANLTFTFCQATRYIDSDTYYFIGSDAESNTMSNTYNVPNVMNIYFVGDAQGYCGYAWFPSSSPDYIVIDNSCATNTSTLAHEIGHYFDLYHTHETTFGIECPDGSNCATAGDRICDTPADPDVSGNVNGSCVYTGGQTACGGQAYMPDAQNLMSYSNKTCRIYFSAEQNAKMFNTAQTSRSYLTYGCTPANDLCSGALPLSCGGSATGSTATATDSDAPAGCIGGGTPTEGVWFSFTGNGQVATVNTTGSAFDTEITIYEGSCGNLNCIGANDDIDLGNGNFASSFTFCTQNGVTYYVYLDGFAGDVGNYQIALSCAPDVTPPAISCPSNVTVNNAPGQCGANVSYPAASASDNCGVASLTYSQNSGTFFPVGSTTVTATATDAVGNSSSCSFTVTVNDNEAPTAVCLNTTVYLQPDGMYTLKDVDVLDYVNSDDNCSFTVTGISPAVVDCDDFETTVPVTVTITDPANNSDNCIANVYVDKSYALPEPWDASDIGNPGTGNSYAYDPCVLPLGEFTIVAGAANNTLGSDNMAFIDQDLCGDFEITAKIESITPNGYAGLMARESSAAGSKMAGVYSNLTNLVRWEARTITNGNKAANFFFKPQPYWLKLVRQGNWFYGYYSFNGANFFYVTAQQIPMGACLDLGMAAFTNIPGSPATAVFSHVTAGGGGLPLVVLPGNTVEPATAGRNISLFPNPTRNVVTVSFSELKFGEAGNTSSKLEFGGTVRLRNELGQLLETRQLEEGTERLDWDVSRLNPGLYFIEVQEEGQAPQMLRFVRAE